MATFYKRKLSGSTNGLGIKITDTATPGTLIHTAVAGTTAGTFDEIWLYAYNGHTAAVTLTVEFGGHTAPDQNIVCSLASKSGLQLIVPGAILQNEMDVNAFASVDDVIVIYGFVNALTD
jgi:hypothetical protein